MASHPQARMDSFRYKLDGESMEQKEKERQNAASMFPKAGRDGEVRRSIATIKAEKWDVFSFFLGGEGLNKTRW